MNALQESIYKPISFPIGLGSTANLELTFNTKDANINPHKHFHESYSFGVGIQGATDFKIKSNKFQLGGENIMIIHPGEVHYHGFSSISTSQSQFFALYIPLEVFSQTANQDELQGFQEPHFRSLLNDRYLTQEISTYCKKNFIERLDPLEKDEFNSNIVQRLLTHPSTNNKVRITPGIEKDYVNKIKDYIESNVFETIRLDHLARIVGLSPNHVLKVFKKTIGISPYSYLLNLRINLSKKMLREKHPLVAVAHACGFYDQSHFHRNFVKIMKVTPKQYQRTFSC